MDGQRDNRYSVGTVVWRAVEFLPEDIRVDLFVGVFAIACVQPGAHRRKKRIDAVDDRGAGIEKQPAARIQAIDAVFDDSNGQIEAQLAAAVSIEPRRPIHEVRWIRDDEIAALVDAIEDVAQDRADIGNPVQPGIDPTVPKRLGIDVRQDNVGVHAGTHETGRVHSPRSAPASDIDDGARSGRRHVGYGMAQRTRKAVGVGPKENGVGRFGRKCRMHEQLFAQARKSHLGAKTIPVGLQLSRLFEQCNDAGRQLDAIKRTTPSEHPFERCCAGGEPLIDAMMTGGSSGREPIMLALEFFP